MKNPIVSAITKTLKLGKTKLTGEYQVCLLPNQVYAILEPVMVEKVLVDLENEKGDVEKRAAIPFYTFMYDQMIMRFGLQSIAIKLIIQMSNGL